MPNKHCNSNWNLLLKSINHPSLDHTKMRKINLTWRANTLSHTVSDARCDDKCLLRICKQASKMWIKNHCAIHIAVTNAHAVSARQCALIVQCCNCLCLCTEVMSWRGPMPDGSRSINANCIALQGTFCHFPWPCVMVSAVCDIYSKEYWVVKGQTFTFRFIVIHQQIRP